LTRRKAVAARIARIDAITSGVRAMSHAVRRPVRPSVLAAVTLHEFEALDRTHGQVVDQLRQLDKLVERIDDEGVDDGARALAASILAFFDTTARAHHEEEERVVFPPLLAGDDAALVQQVQRLQQDHAWLEEDWQALRLHVAAIAEGQAWYEPEVLRQGCEVFGALYLEHIALEESLVYPASKEQQLRDAASAHKRAAKAN
jgi:iron-sulfur cluster repair protein YtfE (RIC family)